MTNSEADRCCRYCPDPDSSDDPFLSPCHCDGSIKHVHKSCLHQWIKENKSRDCELCKEKYSSVIGFDWTSIENENNNNSYYDDYNFICEYAFGIIVPLVILVVLLVYGWWFIRFFSRRVESAAMDNRTGLGSTGVGNGAICLSSALGIVISLIYATI